MAKRVNINLPSAPNIEIRLEGNWVGIERLTSTMAQSIQRGYNRGTKTFATRVLGIVKRSIRSGTPPTNSGSHWPPLAQSTINSWGDHNIYNLTGRYLRSIGIQKYKSRTYIGIPIGARPSNPRSSLTMNQVAILLEYGSRDGRVPARPLWNASYRSFGGPRRLRKVMMEAIRRQLFRDYGINPRQVR